MQNINFVEHYYNFVLMHFMYKRSYIFKTPHGDV